MTRLCLCLVASLLLLPSVGQARVVEKIVAVVGNDIILQSEVEDRAAPMMADIAAISNPGQRAARASAVRRQILERMVDEQLLVQEAADLKLSISSEEVDKSIEQIKKDYGLDDAQLREELRKQGMSLAAYRQNTRREILKYRVINIAVGAKINVSDADVQSYYERHMQSANLQVRASHIFLAIPEGADAANAQEKEKQAQLLLKRAQSGEDFARLAREYSEDPATRAEGGDLGWFGKDILPKPIEELVFSMKADEVRGPVRADRGFHVIKLVGRRAQDPKPLAEVRDQIRGQLRQREMERQTKNFLSELRKKTLVDIRM
ncbi:MAG TPA: peptidylprolyl isomerase [Polyangia bacterium]|jgi:Parvulin-like peptidyl-prolyl isomerase|nr:peptidylprolyl isomerase [Polyangia bacterium]